MGNEARVNVLVDVAEDDHLRLDAVFDRRYVWVDARRVLALSLAVVGPLRR